MTTLPFDLPGKWRVAILILSFCGGCSTSAMRWKPVASGFAIGWAIVVVASSRHHLVTSDPVSVLLIAGFGIVTAWSLVTAVLRHLSPGFFIALVSGLAIAALVITDATCKGLPMEGMRIRDGLLYILLLRVAAATKALPRNPENIWR
jgi:phosphoglycerol transferase MdoB-like AlkP superfamily enzyme